MERRAAVSLFWSLPAMICRGPPLPTDCTAHPVFSSMATLSSTLPDCVQDLASWSREGIAGLQSVVLYSLPELGA